MCVVYARELIISVTLFTPDGQQLCSVLIKLNNADPLDKAVRAFCRWATLARTSVTFHFNGHVLDELCTAQQIGIVSGNAVHARVVDGALLSAPPRMPAML